MSDVKSVDTMPSAHEDELRQGIELLFYAYRDFTAEPDAMLARYGFGRAHHRVIYFVGRHPHMSVSELLGILRITKQSLARVLGQLVRQGFIVQQTGKQRPPPASAASSRRPGSSSSASCRKISASASRAPMRSRAASGRRFPQSHAGNHLERSRPQPVPARRPLIGLPRQGAFRPLPGV